MNAYIAMIAHNLNPLFSEAVPKFSRNSEKFRKLQKDPPNYVSDKITSM